MTIYHGGKQVIGRDIAQCIQRVLASYPEDQFCGYVEPFCGMLSVYRHVPERFGQDKTYLAGDINGSVIEMWKALQKGWKPPSKVSLEKYEQLKQKRFETPDSALKGYVGHEYAYRGIYFSTFRDKHDGQNNHDVARDRVQAIIRDLPKVKFSKGNYTQFSHLKNFVIYCDPPYSNRVQKYIEKFDFNRFLEWCWKMSTHNLVFVSNMEDIPGAQLIYKRPYRGNVEKLFLL